MTVEMIPDISIALSGALMFVHTMTRGYDLTQVFGFKDLPLEITDSIEWETYMAKKKKGTRGC